ncbi:Pyridoxal reductase [Chlorella vulgaris]
MDALDTTTTVDQADLERRVAAAYKRYTEVGLEAQDDDVVLKRQLHAKDLCGGLGQLPSGFVSLDASRTWICYWITHGLALLDAPLPSSPGRENIIQFIASCQGNKLLWGYVEAMDQSCRWAGGVQFAGRLSGIHLFDTAGSYGTGKLNGRSEQLLGQSLQECPGSQATADNVRIAPRLAAYPWRLAPQRGCSIELWVDAYMASLQRVGVEKLALA